MPLDDAVPLIPYEYQVGGSLRLDAPSYVERGADHELFQALLAGEICYVLNARQMGKSSLQIRAAQQLAAYQVRCVTIDMTRIGSEQVTLEQWYRGMMLSLISGLGLVGSIQLKQWWERWQHVPMLQRLGLLLDEILQVHLPNDRIVIFIDEIDSALNLDFPIDDFFTFIRSCYTYREREPAYNRLSWALFGVATPGDLIRDKTRTPFNLGRSISLAGFTCSECQPLLTGLSHLSQPEITLQRILYWTNGQPFLTQKLCQLVKQLPQNPDDATHPASAVDQLVKKYVLAQWESQDQPEHLKTIRDRLLYREGAVPRLLGIYQTILEQGHYSIAQGDQFAQSELQLTGLVEKIDDSLCIKNPIYAEIFNRAWVEEQLKRLRPYAPALQAWVDSHQQDNSRLLRGPALQEVQAWASGQQLSDLDYRFLNASEQYDRQELQQAMTLAQAREVQARLAQEQKTVRLQTILLGLFGVGLLAAIAFGWSEIQRSRQAKLDEIQTLATAANGLFASNRQLSAVVTAIKAKRILANTHNVDPNTTEAVNTALQKAVYSSQEFNQLAGHEGGVLGVAMSRDNQLIASSSNDKTVKIWQRNGQLLHTLKHPGTVFRVDFSRDSQLIVSASLDGKLHIWRRNGELVKQWQAHTAPVWKAVFSPDGKWVASGSSDRTVKLWDTNGKLIKTFQGGHTQAILTLAFSPNGTTIASGGVDQNIALWDVNRGLQKILKDHQAPIWDLAFCNEAVSANFQPLLVSGSSDRTVKVWNMNGKLEQSLTSNSGIEGVDCRGKIIAAGGNDNSISLWQTDGRLIKRLPGHLAIIRDVSLSDDGDVLASASEDTTIKLWYSKPPLVEVLSGHQDTIWGIAASPNSRLIASAGEDRINLWLIDGRLRQSNIAGVSGNSVTFSGDGKTLVSVGDNSQMQLLRSTAAKNWQRQSVKAHEAAIITSTISPDNQTIATAGDDTSIRLWHPNGQIKHKFFGHPERIWQLAYSKDGRYLASASEDGTAKIWQPNGTPMTTLKGHDGVVWGVAFDPMGQFVATSSRDDSVKLWQLDGHLIRTISTQSQGVTRLAFSPDGQRIATAGIDNTVKLWGVDGQLVQTLPGHSGAVTAIEFTPNGSYLLSGGDDGLLIRWDLRKINRLNELDYACKIVKDYLQTNPMITASDRQLCD
jgi:WD40 repeat protein